VRLAHAAADRHDKHPAGGLLDLELLGAARAGLASSATSTFSFVAHARHLLPARLAGFALPPAAGGQ
jgi:hypothetical protein